MAGRRPSLTKPTRRSNAPLFGQAHYWELIALVGSLINSGILAPMQVESTINTIMHMCANDNPRFKPDFFRKAITRSLGV